MDLPGKKKRGRPLGSKNKKKETTKKAKAKLAATADESFEAAFGHVETAPQDTLDEAEENFAVGNIQWHYMREIYCKVVHWMIL